MSMESDIRKLGFRIDRLQSDLASLTARVLTLLDGSDSQSSSDETVKEREPSTWV